MKHAAIIALSVAPVFVLGIKAYITLCLDNLSDDLNDQLDQTGDLQKYPIAVTQNPEFVDGEFQAQRWHPSLITLETQQERREEFTPLE
jgi:hypothetical protein